MKYLNDVATWHGRSYSFTGYGMEFSGNEPGAIEELYTDLPRKIETALRDCSVGSAIGLCGAMMVRLTAEAAYQPVEKGS